MKNITEINRLDEGIILAEFTQVRQILRVILKHTINEIIQCDNDNRDKQEKIDKLVELKDLIENNIYSVTCIIVKLADILINVEMKSQHTRGDQ